MAFKMKGYSPFTQSTGSAESLSEMISNTKTGLADAAIKTGLAEAVISGAVTSGAKTGSNIKGALTSGALEGASEAMISGGKLTRTGGLKVVSKKQYVPKPVESPMKQSDDKMMKKEVQIKKKPNLKTMTTDALVDSLYNISQRPYQGDDSDDAKNFAAYKAEVLRRNPDHDWGMNVDEMD